MFVHEGNPLATFFLEKGWWAYAAYISGEIAVPWLLAKRVPIFTGWAIVFYMTLGGLSGGSNWLFYEWRMGLQAPVIYAVILSFMIVRSLVKRSQAAEPDGLSRDVPTECKLWPC